jgi:hypothetical protein
MNMPVSKTLPPYVSYRTFWNFLDGLKSAVPARIDRSFWGDKLSGSTGGQLIAALKYLKLIDAGGVPTLRLRQIVFAKGPQRSDLLRQLAMEAYPFFLTSLDPASATYSQLEEKLRENFQITSDVGRKCIKFYIGLAGDAAINLAPFVTKKSKSNYSSGAGRKNRRTAAKPADSLEIQPTPTAALPHSNIVVNEATVPLFLPSPSISQMLLAKFPDFDPAWSDEVKLRWFQAFDELLQKVPGAKR